MLNCFSCASLIQNAALAFLSFAHQTPDPAGWIQCYLFPPMHAILICKHLVMPCQCPLQNPRGVNAKPPNLLDQNSPHFFVVLLESPVFLLLLDVLDFGAEAKETEEPPEAADEMAASRSFARSSPWSAACTYHLLDSIVSRRQPMPISVK